MKVINLYGVNIRVLELEGKRVVAGPDLGRFLKMSRISDITSKYCIDGEDKWVAPIIANTGQRIYTTVLTRNGVLKVVNGTHKRGIEKEINIVKDELIPILDGEKDISSIDAVSELKKKNKALEKEIEQLKKALKKKQYKLNAIGKAINKAY